MLATPRVRNIRQVDKRRDGADARPLTVEQLIRETHSILANCGVPMSPSKVKRLVRTYKDRVEHNGFTFAEYIANSVVMNAMQRRIVADELTKVIAYSDPTGETAVGNVMKDGR